MYTLRLFIDVYMAVFNCSEFFVFYTNLYFLVLSLIIVVPFYFFLVKSDQKYILKTSFLIKNMVLIIFFISFMLFTLFIYMYFVTRNSFVSFVILNNSNYESGVGVETLDNASLVIIYLCYLVGFVALFTLGDRFWKNTDGLPILFIYFPLVINLLCDSKYLISMFMYYELLLLPSVYFVYKAGYTRKSHQANVYFFLWTQLGSLISFLAILYLVVLVGVNKFDDLYNFNLTYTEKYWLYIFFFVGFGVKVPIWPFHYWLTKVHVEAPSGFSIFLSGFLVKSAVFCFYKFSIVLNLLHMPVFCMVVCILGVLDASLKMWGQVDIKKLIAYATIQEMNVIYFLFVLGDTWAINAGIIFLFAHGILSSLMFYLIECLYKRTQSRNMYKITGLSVLYPSLGLAIWAMLIIFFGFPGTLKFFAEFYFLSVLVEFNTLLAFFIGFILIFLGSVGFARCWFSVLYGHPGYPKPKMDLTREEIYIISFLVFLSIAPCGLIYFL